MRNGQASHSGQPPEAAIDVPRALVRHRWCIPILAITEHLGGARFAAYRGHLGISRDALSSTLGYLIEQRLLDRNAGYGHPLRPEYVATGAGRAVGPACAVLFERLQRLDVERVALRKWSLPVVGAVGGEIGNFAGLHERLSPITPRALSACLTGLRQVELLRRETDDLYRLTETAREIIPPLAALGCQYRRIAGLPLS